MKNNNKCACPFYMICVQRLYFVMIFLNKFAVHFPLRFYNYYRDNYIVSIHTIAAIADELDLIFAKPQRKRFNYSFMVYSILFFLVKMVL